MPRLTKMLLGFVKLLMKFKASKGFLGNLRSPRKTGFSEIPMFDFQKNVDARMRAHAFKAGMELKPASLKYRCREQRTANREPQTENRKQRTTL